MDSLDFKDFGRYRHISKDLENDQMITCDLGVWFRLERVSSSFGFQRKMVSLFPGVNFKTLTVLRRGGDTHYRAVLSKKNLTNLLNSPNLGSFEDDYAIVINSFYVNNDEDSEFDAAGPETPLKVVEQHKKTEDNVIQIDLKKSSDKNSQPARGVLTYNLLCDFTEIENIMEHFNIEMSDVEALIKPTPAIPSLLVVLKKKLSEWIKEKDVRRDPYILYQPAPQSERMGRTQIWAHINLEDNQFDRRVTIEGIFKRVSNEEIMHTLSYNGDLLSKPKPLTWKGTDIPNGDLVVNMKIHNEFTFIMIKGEAYKVSYAKQERNCNHCLSWNHRSPECQRWDSDGRTLMFDFYQKWQRQVGFQEFQPSNDQQEGDPNDSKTPPTIPEGATSPVKAQKPAGEAPRDPKTPPNLPEEINSLADSPVNLPDPTGKVLNASQKSVEDENKEPPSSEAPDKDDLDPETLLKEYGAKYNQQGTGIKASICVETGEKKQLGSVQRKLFEEESEKENKKPKSPEKNSAEQVAAETEEKEEGASDDSSMNNKKEHKEDKETTRDVALEEKEQAETSLSSNTGSKEVSGEQKEDAKKEEGSAEEMKKRKHGNSSTKLTPESKKVHVNENRQLLKELKRIEKDATKKDLTEVKKKVLKNRLDEFINSNKDAIKRMKEGDRGEFEETEFNIRSFVEKNK